jgi:hypothetical protein
MIVIDRFAPQLGERPQGRQQGFDVAKQVAHDRGIESE